MSTGSEAVRYAVEDAAAWITINRPEARNALNRAVREGLRDAFIAAEADADVAVIVLTGAGDRAFCAGGDLKEMADESLTVPPPDYVPQPGRTLALTKPVVAAVNGVALGGGFLLAQSADLVVASETATFGITEARVGRGAPWAAPLSWLVPPGRDGAPPHRYADLRPTGLEVGLVNAVVAPDELLTRTRALVETIAANAPLSVRAGKAMVYAVAEHGRSAAFVVAEEIWRPVYLSRDAQEGPQAFSEKRSPRWEGR